MCTSGTSVQLRTLRLLHSPDENEMDTKIVGGLPGRVWELSITTTFKEVPEAWSPGVGAGSGRVGLSVPGALATPSGRRSGGPKRAGTGTLSLQGPQGARGAPGAWGRACPGCAPYGAARFSASSPGPAPGVPGATCPALPSTESGPRDRLSPRPGVGAGVARRLGWTPLGCGRAGRRLSPRDPAAEDRRAPGLRGRPGVGAP